MKRRWRILSVVVVLVIAIVYRPVIHYLSLPRAVRASWVEPLSTLGTSYYTGPRELHMDEGSRKLGEYEYVFKANEQKRRLYAVLKSRNGRMGLRQRYATIEGRLIVAWLLVQNGNLIYVHDSSRDGGAPPWSVSSRTPLEIKLGLMRYDEFVEGEPSSADSPVIVFQLKVHNLLESRQIDDVYFY